MQEVEDPLQGFVEEARMSQGLSRKSRLSGSVQFVDLTPVTYGVDDDSSVLPVYLVYQWNAGSYTACVLNLADQFFHRKQVPARSDVGH